MKACVIRHVGVFLALFALACEPPPPPPTQGDAVPELTASGVHLHKFGERRGDYFVSFPLPAESLATRMGFMAAVVNPHDLDGLTLEARALRAGKDGAWLAAEFIWQEWPWTVARVDLDFVADAVQWRMPWEQLHRIDEITWSAVVPEPAGQEPWAAPTKSLVQPLATFLADAGVNDRASWEAAASTCTAADTVKERMAIHHTAGNNGTPGNYGARVKAIQTFHMGTRGWCDIGYHFLVALDGSLWEGRPLDLRGAHVGNHNVANIGMSLMGCFQPGDYCEGISGPVEPTQDMTNSVGALVGLLAGHYGIEINADNVKGHRDHSGANTSCPGNNVYSRLDEIRAMASDGIIVSPVDRPGKVRGVLYDLSVTSGPSEPGNVRIVDGTVTCDCGETTSSRDDDGFWEFELPPGPYVLSATADGYGVATREVQITADTTVWASMGLPPQDQAELVTAVVFDVEEGEQARLQDAFVTFNGGPAQRTGADGIAEAMVLVGSFELQVSREGFQSQQYTGTVQLGSPKTVMLGLSALVGYGPGDEYDPDDSQPGDTALLPETPAPPKKASAGGCACGQGGSTQPALPLLVVGAWLWMRRRHVV